MTGFVLLRVRAHRLLLCSALLSVVLATCVLAALAAFSGAIGDAGLRRSLQDGSDARTLVEVRADVSGLDRARMDAGVRKQASAAYGGLPVRVASSTSSGPYALPLVLRPAGEPKSEDPDLTLLATFDRSRVTMVEGTRPGRATAGGAVPVALPESAAKVLRLRTGDEFTLTDRLGGPPLRVRLTGVYRPVDRTAAYWRLDALRGRGVSTSAFTTYGPLLADPQVFDSGRVAAAAMSWQARADFSGMTADRIDGLRTAVQQGVKRIGRTSQDGAATAQSDLPDLLTTLRGTLLVSRSTLLIGTLQLCLVAAFTLLLVAGLLAEERAGETALLRARGASRARVAGLAGAEALLLAVPAAVVAPLLAGPLVRLLAGHGALARAGVRFEGLSGSAWWVAAGTATACGLAVAGPALRRSAAYAVERAARARRGPLPGAVQAGADVGLVVVAGLAYWQLTRRGSGSGAGVLTAASGGALGVDPVLVAAPALCLLAGTVLALRLLPAAARLGERLAVLARGLPTALTGWQLSRRPGRGTGPALLLVLAVAMGMFAIGDATSWARSQRDQADFAVGTDVRVTDSTTPPFGQGGVYDGVKGVSAVMPANRTDVSLSQGRAATVLTTDTDAAAKVMRLRDDLSGQSLTQLTRPLRTQEGDAGFVLPEDAARLRITARLEALGSAGRGVTDSITAIFEDRYGVRYSFLLRDLPADGASHVLTADFAAEAGLASGAAPAGPLRLTGIQADYLVPRRTEHHRLVISGLRTVAADGSTRAVPVSGDSEWTAATRIDNADFPTTDGHGYAKSRSWKPGSGSDTPLSVRYDTGQEPFQDWTPQGSDTATLTLRARTPAAPALTGVATDAFLRATGAHTGSSVKVSLGGADLTVRVTGTVRALPTTAATAADEPASDGGALLLDLRAVNQALGERNLAGLEPGEWWLATDPGAAARVATALRDRSDIDTVLVRDEERQRLSADPLGAGPQSALPAAVVAAMLLAAAGFGVSAAGAVRERAGEFAVLRALGASRGGLARVIAAEQGLLVVVAVAVGVALGGLLTRLVVPLIVLTAQATHPVPAVLVQLPAGPLLRLLAAVAVVPLVVVVVTALRPGDPAQALRRQGGE
ncbi:MAG: hypothetical protein QOF84_5873 [Streptomyces sp.]|nr:hypothetical protein [Streptomyces sp.]